MFYFSRKISLFIVILLFFSQISYAQDEAIVLNINNRIIQTENAHPFIDIQNRLLVPANVICAYFGLRMDWDQQKEKMVLRDSSASKYVDIKPIIKQDVIFIPLDIIHKYFDGHIKWDKINNTIYITTQQGIDINKKKISLGKKYQPLFQSIENTFFYPKMQFEIYVPKGCRLDTNITHIEGIHSKTDKKHENLHNESINLYVNQFLFNKEKYYAYTSVGYDFISTYQYKINSLGEKTELSSSHHQIPYPIDFVFGEFNPKKILNIDTICIVENKDQIITYKTTNKDHYFYFTIDKEKELIRSYIVEDRKSREIDYILELIY